MIKFEWDNNKNLINIRKHKISFEDAIYVLDLLQWEILKESLLQLLFIQIEQKILTKKL